MTARLRSFTLALALAGNACAAATGASSPSAAPDSAPPRVFVEALVLDLPSGGLAELGIDPATTTLAVVVARSGAKFISSPHALVDDGATMRTPHNAPPAIERGSLENYELAIAAQILEHDQVRLGVNLALGGTRTTSTVVARDHQLIVLDTEVMVDGRRCVLLVRPNIIRSDADLERLYKRKMDEQRALVL